MIEPYLNSLNIDALKPLSGFHNTIYEGMHDQTPIVIRVSDRRTQADIQEEVDVLNRMKGEAPVAKPHAVDGAYVKAHEGRIYAFFNKVKGKQWHETTLTDEVHFNAGRALGTLHASLMREKAVRKASYDEHPDIQLLKGLNKRYDQAIDDVLYTLASYGHAPSEYGLIHGDYLFSNLIYRGEDVTIIDFDDMEHGYYLYDIAVYLFYLLLGGNPAKMDIEANIEVFKHFIRGYLSANDTVHLDFTKIQSMFRLRQLKLLATIKKKFAPENLGPWQKAYIALCEDQMENGRVFTPIPYQTLYEEVRRTMEEGRS